MLWAKKSKSPIIKQCHCHVVMHCVKIRLLSEIVYAMSMHVSFKTDLGWERLVVCQERNDVAWNTKDNFKLVRKNRMYMS